MAARPVSKSCQEYARGVAGGLLFSLPLLYTMESWWTGFTASPEALIVYVLGTFALLLGYNRYAGIREDATWAEVVIDSVEEMGLGILIAGGFLWLLERISLAMPLAEIAGKVIIEAMAVAIGVSVGTAQLGGGEQGTNNPDTQDHWAGEDSSEEYRFGGQMVIAFCGAVLFAANIAPTEEVVMIATGMPTWNVLGLALLSMILGAFILYYSNFIGADRVMISGDVIDIIFGVVIMYAIALLASASMLWFFDRFEGLALITCVSQTVVLGVASTLGASAGRLLLQ